MGETVVAKKKPSGSDFLDELISVFIVLLNLQLIFIFQQTNHPVSIRSERRGVVSLPLLEGVLWSFTFPLLRHPHQGKNVNSSLKMIAKYFCLFVCVFFF